MGKKQYLTADEILAIEEDPWETAFRRLSEAVQNGKAPDSETLRFIADAGDEIRKGKDPKQALGIRRKRGPKSDEGLGLQIALYVEKLIELGTTRQEAFEDAAEHFSKSTGLVKQRYYEKRELILMDMEIKKHYSTLAKPFGGLFEYLLRKKSE